MIACVLIPAFLAAVERQFNAALADEPLIIHAGDNRRYVYALGAGALRQGVLPGMPVSQARGLCPDASLLVANVPRYREALDTLAESLALFSHKAEVAGLPRFGKRWRRRSGLTVEAAHYHAIGYLDLGKLKASEALALGRQLRDHLQTVHHVQAQVGMASNKFTACIAAHVAQTDDVRLVPLDHEARFLAPHSVRLLPADDDIRRRLGLFGITTIGAFAALPRSAVVAQFGKPGRLLHQLACGEDQRAVPLWTPPRQEALRQPLLEPISMAYQPVLAALITQMAQQLGERLAKSASAARVLRLTLHTPDGVIHEGERRLRRPNAEAAHLTSTLLAMFERLALRGDIVEISVTAADLVDSPHQQLALFPDEDAAPDMAQVLEDLSARFGGAFYQAALVDAGARLPEQRFELNTVEAA